MYCTLCYSFLLVESSLQPEQQHQPKFSVVHFVTAFSLLTRRSNPGGSQSGASVKRTTGACWSFAGIGFGRRPLKCPRSGAGETRPARSPAPARDPPPPPRRRTRRRAAQEEVVLLGDGKEVAPARGRAD